MPVTDSVVRRLGYAINALDRGDFIAAGVWIGAAGEASYDVESAERVSARGAVDDVRFFVELALEARLERAPVLSDVDTVVLTKAQREALVYVAEATTTNREPRAATMAALVRKGLVSNEGALTVMGEQILRVLS